MPNPQQPELARSRRTPAQDPDAAAAVVEGQRQPEAKGPTGPVPAENQPGHHPEREQDTPDLDAYAAKLGVTDEPAAGAEPSTSTSTSTSEAVTSEAVAGAGRGAAARIAAVVAGIVALVGAVVWRRRRAA